MIARKSAIVISGKVISAALGYLALFLIVRYLHADTLGIIVYAMSIVAVFNFAADLGFIAAHIKAVNYGVDFRKCIGTFAMLRLLLTGLMVGILLGSIAIWKFALHKHFFDVNETVLYIFIGYFVILNLSTIITNTFDARLESGKSQMAQVMELLVRLPLVGVVIILNLGVVALSLAYVAGAVAIAMAALLLFRGYQFCMPDRESIRTYARFAAPFFVLSLIGTLWMYADDIMLGYFWTAKDLGLFVGVQYFTNFLYMFSITIGVVLLPALASEYAKKNKQRIKAIIHNAERYIAMIIIPPVVFIVVFADSIVTIMLNNQYVAAADALRLLAVYIGIVTIANPYSQILLASDKIWQQVKLSIVCFVFFVVFQAFLVAKWGLYGIRPLAMGVTGAALAWLVYSFFGTTLTRYQAYGVTGTFGNYRIFAQFFAGAVLFLALWLASIVIHVSRWYELFLMAGAALGIYFGVLIAIGEFSKTDVNMVLEILLPGRAKQRN